MQPGREMDAAVAEGVMGYAFYRYEKDNSRCYHCGRGLYDDENGCDGECCHYSTDDDAAWTVVRAMWEKGYEINLSRDDGQIDCDFREADKEWVWASAPTLPHAVCMAALRAMGVEA